MERVSRRGFLGAGAACAVFGSGQKLLPAALAAADPPGSMVTQVNFLTDGLLLTPLDYAQLLMKLASSGAAKRDTYLAGGSVAELEERFALALGKERALFVPTGTLANHLALRHLATGTSRVIVQAESHIYCDSSDCVQTLSHLNLVPLAEGKATFTLGQVEEAVQKAARGPYPVRVGAISIECPVRRMNGQAFDYQEMKRVSGFARKKGIKLHLDGARLYIASAYTGIPPAEYAALFDTVYISLYKYFNAPGGAILAGPKGLLESIAQARKVFGSGIYQTWPYAAVAGHYFEGFADRYKKAVEVANALFARLTSHAGFRVEGFPGGTNICKLHVKQADLQKYWAALQGKGVMLPPPSRDRGFRLVINESLSRRSPEELARTFIGCLLSS